MQVLAGVLISKLSHPQLLYHLCYLRLVIFADLVARLSVSFLSLIYAILICTFLFSILLPLLDLSFMHLRHLFVSFIIASPHLLALPASVCLANYENMHKCSSQMDLIVSSIFPCLLHRRLFLSCLSDFLSISLVRTPVHSLHTHTHTHTHTLTCKMLN